MIGPNRSALPPGSRVVLLNPPWRGGVLRDYFCTSIPKTGYLWPPIELLAQSGQLAEHGLVPVVLDAVAEELSGTDAHARLSGLEPAAVLALTSPLTAEADLAFLRGWAHLPVFVTGEQAVHDPQGLLARHPWLTGVLTDFTTPDLARWLRGAPPPAVGVALRGVPAATAQDPPFDLPPPLHELFLHRRYRMPGLGDRPFATLLTDFGCPHRCRYCNSGSLGHRLRALPGVLRELQAIRALGLTRVFLKDMSFGRPAEHAEQVCAALARAGVTWTAYVRPDDLTPAFARRLAEAGCRLVRMGLESGDPELRARFGKGFSNACIEQAAAAAREAGLGFGAHLVLGLPGESLGTLLATRRMLHAIRPDYVSLNLAELRHGSRVEASPVVSVRGLGLARTCLYVDYYARPSYVWPIARQAARDGELSMAVRQGLGLAWRLLRPEPGGRRS